jgi:pimeloyl-ACP methyl ester carboxylesterase
MAARKIEIAADQGKVYMTGSYSMPSTLSKATGAQTLAIMVHGFPGSSEGHDNLYALVSKVLNEYGIHTLSFDFRGCGHSEGEEEDFTLARAAEDLRLVLEWATHQMFEEIILVGEGVGAHLCLHAPLTKVKAMIFFWPVIDLGHYANHLFRADDMLANNPDKKYAEIGGHRISLDLLCELTQAGFPPLPELTIPVLVQYGLDDHEVPPAHHIEKMKEQLHARRLDITGYQEGGHGLLEPKHRKTMLFHIQQFIEKFG